MTALTRDAAAAAGLLCECGDATAEQADRGTDQRLPSRESGGRRGLCQCYRRRRRQAPDLRR